MRVLLDRFHVGTPTEIGPLTLFPVWSEAPVINDVLVTPRTGLSVNELDEPTVPFLQVSNANQTPVLLTEGTLLHGGRQTRVLNHDVLLDPVTRTHVEVSCVEQGRWNGESTHDIVGRVPLSVIATLRDTGAAQRDSNRRGERQHQVWTRVAQQGTRFGRSETANLRELMDGDTRVARDDEQARRERARRSLSAQLRVHASRVLPGQAGFMIGALGHPLALEIITNPREFARNVDALLESLALDVAGLPVIPTPGRRARRFAEIVTDIPLAMNWEDRHAMSFGAHEMGFNIQSLNFQDDDSASLHTLIVSTKHDLALAA